MPFGQLRGRSQRLLNLFKPGLTTLGLGLPKPFNLRFHLWDGKLPNRHRAKRFDQGALLLFFGPRGQFSLTPLKLKLLTFSPPYTCLDPGSLNVPARRSDHTTKNSTADQAIPVLLTGLIVPDIQTGLQTLKELLGDLSGTLHRSRLTRAQSVVTQRTPDTLLCNRLGFDFGKFLTHRPKDFSDAGNFTQHERIHRCLRDRSQKRFTPFKVSSSLTLFQLPGQIGASKLCSARSERSKGSGGDTPNGYFWSRDSRRKRRCHIGGCFSKPGGDVVQRMLSEFDILGDAGCFLILSAGILLPTLNPQCGTNSPDITLQALPA